MIKTNKFRIRFIVVFLIHITIKSFDLSFPGGPFELNWRSLWFSVYFIGYGLLLWYLAEWFDLKIRSRIKNSEGNREKTLLLFLCHAVFGYGLVFTVNLFYRLSDVYLFNYADLWESISCFNPELIVSLLSLYLLIYGFDSYSRMHNKLQEKQLREEQLKKENITAQYKALKAQIEPHFLFNSLSVLSSLVYEDPDYSADFIVKLSKTLRYIIEKNEFNLVKLSEELGFLNSYYFLIKTRLEEGVFLENNLEEAFVQSTFIPPVTLQLLFENAINHNTCNPAKPLRIIISKEDDRIIFRNNLNPRSVLKESTKKGLKNIRKRYELICNRKVEVIKTETEFVVKLPVLNQTDYEGFTI
uniref:sensor histidine kinase n=1 Tax=uncultured Draconibacterium sp. TaxID=1573823 RepID=UPI003217BC2B